MKKNIFKILLMCSGAFFASCTDLEEDLIGEIDNAVSIVEASSDFEGGGNGGNDALSVAYSQLRSSGSANHGGYWSIQSVSTDEMAVTQKGGDWYDGGIWIDMHRHTYGPSNGPIDGTWSQTYTAIAACNDLLATSLDANQTAQIRVLRALFYFRLLDLYGRVKIITSTGTDAPQSTRLQVFNFVESELLAAIGIPSVTASMDLSNSPLGVDVNPYRVNQYAALGLLSKLYLNAEVYTGTPRYTEAANAASYVIDNSGYILCGEGCSVPNPGKRPAVDTDPDELEGYAAVFAPNNQDNPEIIWSIAYDAATGGGMNFHVMSLHYSSQFTWNFENQPWNGYSALEDFYNSYDDDDARKAASFIVGQQYDYNGSAILDYAATDGELELNYTPDINELEPNASRKGGARLGKFSNRLFQRQEMDNDMPIIRLGELYLIRAEGMARATGDWSMAAADVNTIRARAGLDAMTTIDADSFLAERGREMFMEATRRQDLIRFGKYDDPWWEKTNSDAYKSLFPIPQPQIDAAQGTLTQNPGY
ncbi:RagB/SusD family nutrient uptake outer membrane protein [Maribacter polysaccharolyticus]|uniref:RagB/SusD family nutrient uptake outer membrane protein n=1 Tax=Maribacter polysaccharolyticus TaxID=3020831 RepID=UPI00237F68FF|nr:RagB/SusD family nutrient uptake outer membrane protein [Maribacter polysaccharolyticus]MDE3742943.1 RagB/SusD family nutrient uptake outer membrane protein [Maribacter polysaccharolyticus]